MIGAITGVLASRSTAYEYFTSALYPFVVDDALSVSAVAPQPSELWENPNDDISVSNIMIVVGTLNETIVYKTYNEPLYNDPIGVETPQVISGNLVETIIYKVYNEPLATEPIGIQLPDILSGNLVETIVYIVYNNGEIEDIGIEQPIIVSGTLI